MSVNMIAAVSNESGGFDIQSIERPAPAPTEVLVKVSAIGLNPADWVSRDPQQVPPDMLVGPGEVMGWDLAGTVVELGMGVTRFKVGDQVFGMPCFPKLSHSYAEFTTARSREVAKIPDGVSMIEAGAIPLAGLTAWQTLVDVANVSAGDKVLIHAASGGVGHLAVQIAKAHGATVWGTASAHNHEKLRELGADHLIDYRKEKFEDVAKEMDIVLVLGGGPETADRSVGTLRKGGHLICVAVPPPAPEVTEAAGVDACFFLVEPDYKSLESLAELMATGKLKVTIAEQRPLAEMTELHELGAKGSSLGKLVATV